jgi:glycosyltransferase involved in cell wall biosynthesis
MRTSNLPRVARILYLNPTSEVGGAERSLLDLLEHLDRKQYYPIVCFPSEGKLAGKLSGMGIEMKMIPLHKEISRLSRQNGNRRLLHLLSTPWRLFPTITKTAGFVRSKHVDLIVTNGIKCHVIGSIVSSMTGAKLIWHVRDFIETGLARFLLTSMGRFFPDRIITNSDAVGSFFVNSGRTETVYNGVDLARFDSEVDGGRIRSEFKLGKDNMLIGTIGHFAPLKGYEQLLEAMEKVVGEGFDVKLALVGDSIYPHSNTYKQKILSLVNSMGLRDRIIFTGFRDDIPELLASFDLFVLPSRSEGFGRVNLEAMAMGKPVISTSVGGIPEVVSDEITGILVPPGNSTALSHAIMRLLSDSHLRKSMGRKGRRRVEEQFSLQAHVQRIEEIYQAILCQNRLNPCILQKTYLRAKSH